MRHKRICKRCRINRPRAEFSLQEEHGRNLRYCDDCFRIADKRGARGLLRTCLRCQEQKPVDEFGTTRGGNRQKICLACPQGRSNSEVAEKPRPHVTQLDEILGHYRASIDMLRAPIVGRPVAHAATCHTKKNASGGATSQTGV